MSPHSDICLRCSTDECKRGKLKSISFCTSKVDRDIKLMLFKKIRNVDSANSRIYVIPASNGHKQVNTLVGNVIDSFSTDRSTGMSPNDYDEDHTFMPLISSPADSSLFSSSPQSEFSKITTSSCPSPQSFVAGQRNLPLLSPLGQASSNYISPKKLLNDTCKQLASGFLLSGSSDDKQKNAEPSVLRVCNLFYFVFPWFLFF